jgi:hypothetical protein
MARHVPLGSDEVPAHEKRHADATMHVVDTSVRPSSVTGQI